MLTLTQLAVPPQEIRVRLRSGDGRPLSSADVNGAPVGVLSGDVIVITPQTSGQYQIVGKF
jgi:hypothetical protein